MTNHPSLPYRPKERKLYRYWDGSRWVRADPLVLNQRFNNVQQDLAVSLKIAAFPNYPAAPSAHSDAVLAVRDVFNLVPYEEGGLTESECISLLDHFLTYFRQLRKKFEPLSDGTGGSMGQLRLFLGRKPTYEEFYGLWLNRDRVQYRSANAVALGASIALGAVVPGDDYFRAVSDSDVEARTLRGQMLAARGSGPPVPERNGVNHGR